MPLLLLRERKASPAGALAFWVAERKRTCLQSWHGRRFASKPRVTVQLLLRRIVLEFCSLDSLAVPTLHGQMG